LAAGGELHQIAGGEHPALTTNQGVAISDNQNSLKANPRGPTLLEDFILREKITHFGKDPPMGPGKVRSNISLRRKS
jgi:catalase